jgi:hypothetical protein
MEAKYSTETSVDFQRTTWHCIPEDRTLHNHRCENLRLYTVYGLEQRMMNKVQEDSKANINKWVYGMKYRPDYGLYL